MLLFYFWEFGPSRLFLYFLSEENVLSPGMFPVLFLPVFECPPTALPYNPVPEYYGIYTCRCGSLPAVSSDLPGSSSSSDPKILDHLLILQGILIIRLRAELSPLYHIYLLCHLSILNLKSVFSQSMHVYIDIYILLYPEIIASLFRKH